MPSALRPPPAPRPAPRKPLPLTASALVLKPQTIPGVHISENTFGADGDCGSSLGTTKRSGNSKDSGSDLRRGGGPYVSSPLPTLETSEENKVRFHELALNSLHS